MRTVGSGSQDPFSTTNFKLFRTLEKIKNPTGFQLSHSQVFEPAVFKDGSHNPLIKNKSIDFLI
jgi:hypothetical protein